ncbi:MAG: hypothetical protein ACRCVG_02850 [Methanobacteriaceae archaeon]
MERFLIIEDPNSRLIRISIFAAIIVISIIVMSNGMYAADISKIEIKKIQKNDIKNKFKVLKSKNYYKVWPKYIAISTKIVKSISKCSCGACAKYNCLII